MPQAMFAELMDLLTDEEKTTLNKIIARTKAELALDNMQN